MEKNKKEGIDKIGDYALLSVPREKRKGFLSLAWVNAGYTINLGCIFGGGALALMLPLGEVFIALLVAAVILAIFGGAIGSIGAKYGLSTTVLSRHSFGRHGSWLVGGILAITLGIGWFGWQVALFGDTIHAIFPGNFLTIPAVACIWGGILMIITAVYGFRGLSILSFIVVPMILVVCLFGVIAAVGASGAGLSDLFAQEPLEHGTLPLAITMAVGITAAGACGMADITRYGKSPKHAAVSGPLGYLGGALFCEFAGAIMVVATQFLPIGSTPDLIAGMVALGLGVGALGALIFAQWTTNDNNLYSGSLGITNIIPISKRTACIIMGGIGIGIAVAHIQDYFVTFLTMLGLVVPPIAGIILSDFFVLRKYTKREYDPSPGSILPSVNVLAVACAIAAAVISYYWVCIIPGAVLAIVIAFVGYGILGVIFEKMEIKYLLGRYEISETGY